MGSTPDPVAGSRSQARLAVVAERLHAARGWLALGLVQGAVLLSGMLAVHEAGERLGLAAVFGAFSFLLTGILLGYRSRHGDLFESVATGLVLALGLAVVVVRVLGHAIGPLGLLGIVVGGVVFTVCGGALGLRLRTATTEHEVGDGQPSWPWIVAGTVLGVVLNIFGALVLDAVASPSQLLLAGSFATSFLVGGAFVGYHSPGRTLWDPAVTGVLVLGAEWLMLLAVFGVWFPVIAVVVGAFAGFTLVLGGGWIGLEGRRLRTT